MPSPARTILAHKIGGYSVLWCLVCCEVFAQATIGATPSPHSTAVSFRNDVMAVLSKAGCNAGTCHGNKNGKGGFKLSLRGQDPDVDYLTLTRDSLARRIDPLEPEESLLLLKPNTQVAHEGGLRFKKESEEYAIIRGWIAQGMPNDLASAPKLERIEILPREEVAVEPEREVQLHVRAWYSEGSTRDVTSLAVYEPANGLAKVSHDGLVERQGMGETTVLVRYLHCQEPVRLAFVPARPNFDWQQPPVQNYVDDQIFRKLRALRMNPSDLCSDEVFLRRAYLDLLGVLPTAEEARAFVGDRSGVGAPTPVQPRPRLTRPERRPAANPNRAEQTPGPAESTDASLPLRLQNRARR